jgi:hypothetical protein
MTARIEIKLSSLTLIEIAFVDDQAIRLPNRTSEDFAQR